MKTLIVYDSQHGHTEKIAFAIGEASGARVEHVGKVGPVDLAGLDLLIVGSPTHGGWYTEPLKALLDALPGLEGGNVAAFDTRTATIWNRILPFGYAAPRIAQKLEASGGKLIAPPEGFVVEGIKGPLKDGELERAARWAKGLLKR
ncbi:MAG: flavodoxin [Anaerolineae bacterium]|nr:flavodoxin [Anaerolineae bacterium]